MGAYGDAGAIVTNDDELAEQSRSLRQHGSKKKYFHETVGYNSRLDALHAAILSVKLRYLDQWIKRRIEIAKLYQSLFEEYNLPLKYPKIQDKGYRYHVFHQYVVEFRDNSERELARKHLNESKIGTSIYYPLPLHLQKCFEEYGYEEGAYLYQKGFQKQHWHSPYFLNLLMMR